MTKNENEECSKSLVIAEPTTGDILHMLCKEETHQRDIRRFHSLRSQLKRPHRIYYLMYAILLCVIVPLGILPDVAQASLDH